MKKKILIDKLLPQHVEYIKANPIKIIMEASGKKKVPYFVGPVIMVGQENSNERIYDAADMERAVKTYKKEFISQSRAVGELGHRDDLDIDPERVSHRFTEITKTNKNFWGGKAKILDEERFPRAKIVRGFIEEGIPLGMSTRGIGDEDDLNGIITNYYLAAIDIVWDPSVKVAMQEVIFENKQKWLNEGQNDFIKNIGKKCSAKEFKVQYDQFINNLLIN